MRPTRVPLCPQPSAGVRGSVAGVSLADDVWGICPRWRRRPVTTLDTPFASSTCSHSPTPGRPNHEPEPRLHRTRRPRLQRLRTLTDRADDAALAPGQRHHECPLRRLCPGQGGGQRHCAGYPQGGHPAPSFPHAAYAARQPGSLTCSGPGCSVVTLRPGELRCPASRPASGRRRLSPKPSAVTQRCRAAPAGSSLPSPKYSRLSQSPTRRALRMTDPVRGSLSKATRTDHTSPVSWPAYTTNLSRAAFFS